jgi:1-acyl-sn-glycerol-3-phosphate acyltransferase
MDVAPWNRWTWAWIAWCLAAGVHVAATGTWLWLCAYEAEAAGRSFPWNVALLAGLAGAIVAVGTWHPRRSLGWLPWTFPLATLSVLFCWPAGSPWAVAGFALLNSLIFLSLLGPIAALAPRPPGPLLAGIALHIFAAKLVSVYLLTLLSQFPKAQGILITLGLVASLSSWIVGYRVALERLVEGLIWPLYRIRALGPGVGRIPLTGPLVVIGNHTNMLDPLFLGKIMPRRMIPMMTSKYYDLPVLSFFMRYVVGTIRVEDNRRKKEAPEIDEAVARLRQGHCVMIFPEGRLKRQETPVLNYFAQGIWHILKQVPEARIVATWIDGAWGAYLSYRHGPPGVGKPFDWWRPITIVVAEPFLLPPEVLETHQKTRRFLTDFVLGLRAKVPGLQVAEAPLETDVDEAAAPAASVDD